MRLDVLDATEQDLIDGAHFCEAQEPGLGQYFLAYMELADRRQALAHVGDLAVLRQPGLDANGLLRFGCLRFGEQAVPALADLLSRRAAASCQERKR
jgi:hypothetical protein